MSALGPEQLSISASASPIPTLALGHRLEQQTWVKGADYLENMKEDCVAWVAEFEPTVHTGNESLRVVGGWDNGWRAQYFIFAITEASLPVMMKHLSGSGIVHCAGGTDQDGSVAPRLN